MITLIVAILILTSFSVSFAELKTFVKDYTYQASEEDSRNSSRTVSLVEVKRLLLEELGTYLESITEVKNFRLTKDQITILTAGIVRTEIIDEKWDGKVYWLKAKITADPESVVKSIDKLRQDKQKVKDLEDIQKKVNTLLKENERLIRKLETSKGIIKEEIYKEYAQGINELDSIELYRKGNSLYESGNYSEAANAFTMATTINLKFAEAYNNRGNAYAKLGDNQKALRDYNKAIEFNPQLTEAYANRRNAEIIIEKNNRDTEKVKGIAPTYTPEQKQAIQNEKERKKEEREKKKAKERQEHERKEKRHRAIMRLIDLEKKRLDDRIDACTKRPTLEISSELELARRLNCEDPFRRQRDLLISNPEQYFYQRGRR